MARTSKYIPVFVFDLLSLNSLLFISCIALLAYIHILDIVCAAILVLNQESFSSSSTLSLEKSRGVVSEPFTGNSDPLLITHSVLAI